MAAKKKSSTRRTAPKRAAPFPWASVLERAELVGRYVRFLCDARLDDGTVVRAHCANSGRMEGLVVPGSTIYLSRSASRTRKLPLTWQLSELDGVLVGTDTSVPNRFVKDALERGLIDGAGDEGIVRPERPFGDGHRVDFVVGPEARPHYIEVKNCHLVYPDGFGYFPDSKSERATRHVRDLIALRREGTRASIWFTIQRSDAKALRPSVHHDPAFAAALREAHAAGVEMRAFVAEPTLAGLVLAGEVPVDVAPYDVEPITRYATLAAKTAGWKGKTPPLETSAGGSAAAAPSRRARRRDP